GGPQNFVVGHGDGFADALLGGAGLAFEPPAHTFDRNRGGPLTCVLSANTVDHQEDAAIGIGVPRIFGVAADSPRVAAAREPESRLNHWMCRGTPGTPRPRVRCARSAARALPHCGRASRHPRAPRSKARAFR